MAITDYKVSETYAGRDIASLPDRPNEAGMSAPLLKARFDQLGKEVIPNYNDLIDFINLNLFSGGTQIGHTHNVDILEDGTTNRLYTNVEKTKLAGIENGAEVNQNAFSNVKVGSTTIASSVKTDTLELVAGLNVSIAVDALTKKITLSATGDLATEAVQSYIEDIGNYFTSLNVEGALQEIGLSLLNKVDKVAGKGLSTEDYTSAEKTKLSGITENANNYVHPATHLPSIIGQDEGNRFVTDTEKTSWNGKQDTLVSGTNIKTINGNELLGSGNLQLEEIIIVALSDEVTALTTGTAKSTFRMPYACKLTSTLPRININTVSSSGLVTVDVNKNGTSIFSTLLTIDVGEKTSVTAVTPCALSATPTTFTDDQEITCDIDVSGTDAKGLKLTLFVERV